MSIFEIVLIGIGLSMDAVAVSMTNGMVYRNMTKLQVCAMPVFFGIFQGIMPLIGYFAGGIFAEIIERYAGILILLILGFIGGKMVKEGIEHYRSEKEEAPGAVCDINGGQLKLKVLLLQSVATSIDAFAVGVGFVAVRVDIVPTVCLIAAVTAALVTIAIFIGRKFGDLLGCKAEIFGGIILIIIGIKAIL